MGKWGDEMAALANRMTSQEAVASLRGHVLSLSEQAQGVDNELLALKTKIQQMQGEHSDAVAKLKEENAQLLAQIKELEAKQPKAPDSLSPKALEVLRLLFDTADQTSAPELAHMLKMGLSPMESIFDELKERKFIKVAAYGFTDTFSGRSIPARFKISPQGRTHINSL